MTRYRCIVIDDEELARELLENFISRLPNLELVGKYSSPLAALDELRDDKVDLVFLDIQMPEMTGLEFLRSLSRRPAVIFTTAYDRYALESYELSVIDYLLKPFSFSRFVQAVNKAVDWISLKRSEGRKEPLQQNNPEVKQEFLLIHADHKVYRLYLRDILYIQSMKEYVTYFSATGKIMALGSLKGLGERLPASDFIRIHKSYIVAKDKVSTLEGNQLQVGDRLIPIGGNYRATVISELFEE